MNLGLFSGLENFLEDRLFFEKSINPDIVIVGIDNASIEHFGQWPWPRSVFAEFFTKLDKYQPGVVGLDILFAEPSRLGLSDDLSLSNSLKKLTYPVVFPVEFQDDKAILPIESLRSATTLGFVNLIMDRDGVVRKFPVKIGDYRPFGYQVATTINNKVIQSPNISEINRIVYAGPPRFFKQVSFWQVMTEDLGDQLKNKIILVGVTTPDLHDDKPTPVSSGQNMAGVEIQANIVNMLLSDYHLTPLNPFYFYSWLALAAFLPLLILYYSQSLWKLFFFNAGAGFIYLIFQVLLFRYGMATNVIHIQLAWIIASMTLIAYQYLIVGREKNELRKIFAKYVSPKVLEEILRDPRAIKLGGEEREVTLFFSDIRGFTTLSEKTTPTQLVDIINRYFSAVTKEIIDNDGVVDKYIGDAIMAFWGAPLRDDQQADKALKASLGILKRLEQFNKELKRTDGVEIKIGIGLFTGRAVVGNVGSMDRFDYTAMGDTVNIASRLEGLTKEYGVQLILGESTKQKIKGDYQFKFLGSAHVKGRKEPISIYTCE